MFNFIKDFFNNEWYYYKKRITKRYYIIKRPEPGAGFFSNYYWVMGHVVFARKLGYIPVVDMQNSKTLYSEDKPLNGMKNAWNYYFENIGEVTLEDAYQSGKYVFAQEKPLNKYGNRFCLLKYRFPTTKTINYYYPIIKKNLRIRPELLEEMNKDWEKSTVNCGKILGIHVRGTDMRINKTHPTPAIVQKYFNEMLCFLKKHPDIERIFIATDELNVIDFFKKNLVDKKYNIFFNKAFRVVDTGKETMTGVHETIIENPRKNHKYKMGLEVLKDAYFLSKCDYLICGHSNVANVVLIWNHNKFKEVLCIEGE